MFLPIVSYSEGYGFTYGARASFVDVLGEGGRVSVPLTWGGTRRAAVEIEKTFDDDIADQPRVQPRAGRRRHLAARESALRTARHAPADLGTHRQRPPPRAARRRRRQLDRRRLWPARGAVHAARQPLHHGGRRRDGGYAARSDLSAQRRVCADGLGAAEFQQRAVDQSLSQRSARLPWRDRPVGAGGAGAASARRSAAAALRAGAARRRIDPARSSRRRVRGRQPVRLVGRTARAAQLADGRRPARRHARSPTRARSTTMVCGCATPPSIRASAAASSCWRRCSSSISTWPTASTTRSASTS